MAGQKKITFKQALNHFKGMLPHSNFNLEHSVWDSGDATFRLYIDGDQPLILRSASLEGLVHEANQQSKRLSFVDRANWEFEQALLAELGKDATAFEQELLVSSIYHETKETV